MNRSWEKESFHHDIDFTCTVKTILVFICHCYSLCLYDFLVARTYPTHPYFVVSDGPGQTALYEVLHAYSNLDKEVGYCQGLGFVAGQFIIHVSSCQKSLQFFPRYMYMYCTYLSCVHVHAARCLLHVYLDHSFVTLLPSV